MRRALITLAIAAAASPAGAVEPVASFRYLVTGNGQGFQVFDIAANAIKQYLERPYRYLRPNASAPDGEGIVRRNLAFDTYFGVRVGGTSAWLGGMTPSEVGYVMESNVIRSAVTVAGVQTQSYYFAPYGYPGNAMVMLLEVTNTTGSPVAVTAFSNHNFKLGSAPNPDAPGSDGEAVSWDGTAATETGPGGGAMVYAPISGADIATCDGGAFQTLASGGTPAALAHCNGSDVKATFVKSLGSLAPGASAWWGVAVIFDGGGDAAAARQAWTTLLNGRGADQVLADALAEHEAWRKPPIAGVSADELATWRQAESVLRMGQITEPWQDSPRLHNHGMLLASLPPGGWHTGWVRDASYATVALARSGHGDMARDSLDFFLGADAGKFGSYLGNVPYRISVVRYFGDGEEEADYSGQPTRNIEIDGWGLVLWAARAYVDATGDVAWLSSTTKQGDVVYDAIKAGIADALAANMDQSGLAIADASIWEVHWGNRQHFLYTTAAAARGFCDMATLARRAGKMDDVKTYKTLAQKAVAAMSAGFIDSDHVLAGSLERLQTGSSYHDGATVEPFTWSLIDAKDPIAKATLDGLSFLRTPAGGFKRVEGSSDQYDTDEWILIDLRASAAYRRAGQTDQADQLLAWVTGQASANFGLLPELYNAQSSAGQIGAYSGSIPMVGYGAGAYLMTLLDRAGMYEPSDCGDYDQGQYPDGGVGPGPGGAGADGRTGVACACQGGRGASGTGVIVVLAGALALRRRRRSRSALAVAIVAGALGTSAADPDQAAAPKGVAALEQPSTTDTVAVAPAPAAQAAALDVGEVKLELHGYARMPLSTQGTREPYLVDNDYYLSGFAYTRLYEPDWSELFFSARRGAYKAEFGLFASLYSDYASAQLANQLGIAQASVTADNFLDQRGLSVQVGVFWDRYGYLAPYDTYIFGRTHQGGAKIAYALPGGGRVQAGLGLHEAELQQNQGTTPIAHVAAEYPIGPATVGAYAIRTWTRDKRQLSPIQDGTMYVAGLDARYPLPDHRGTAYLAFAYYDMTKVLYLAPALEVMHSTGGRGLTENFLGTDASDDGTGHMFTLAADAPIRIDDALSVRAFGMASWVRSKQVDETDPLRNKDRRLYVKWGVEPSYRVLPKLAVALRFDRVILDVYDSQDSFRVLSPKLSFPLDRWGELFVQYSHYWYGDKITLRPGQVPLETMPDHDVFKLQAQAVW